uniref:Uncharacterized protein n=1 Tax=Caenorhabditis japonica TaxID=281687 RepID=A0A8R1ILA2_CAEJA
MADADGDDQVGITRKTLAEIDQSNR